MASFKALCLAGVASLAVTAANAADLLPPPPPVEAPLYAPPVAVGSNWYLRGDVGVGIADLKPKSSTFAYTVPDVRYEANTTDDSAIIDAGVGYRFNEYFRADVTGEYRAATAFSAVESYNQGYYYKPKTAYRQYDFYNGSMRSIDGLVNGYVDAGTWYGVTPFVGAGVGIANNSVGHVFDNDTGYAGAHSTTNFAFAFMAGIDVSVTQNLKMELGYRYLNLGNASSAPINCLGQNPCPNEVQHYKLASNDIRLGFRYILPDLIPEMAPQLPLIRKY